MTARQPPLWDDTKNYPADLLRGVVLIEHSGKTGVLPQLGVESCKVAPGTGAQVTVQPGAVVMPDGLGGAALGQITAVITLSLTAAPAAGTSRIDMIVAQYVTGGTWSVAKVDGVAAASPTAPALPAKSVQLGQATVPNTGPVTVADTRDFTVAPGGALIGPAASVPASLPNNSIYLGY